MRVDLTEFCQDFTAALRPLSQSLDDTIVSLHDLEDPASLRSLLSAFVDTQHRLKILTDKAEQQHAYLLIFGPLKSGKSTLMNAISGAYVSEVSSLPAYPCLVYVHEGDERNRSATRFDGTREEFDSDEALHGRIEEAHAEIAEQLRLADREQRNFNPAVEYPRAIRRIDYVVPAPNLRQSGTILVDTPGLYTKMRYNYEQLTRDFRNNAACAVFVVKTDNLFFDQVFDEFKDLLGVFSRVFLVVNIDSSKKDLTPDGDLRPALESREPRRIIQAFEDYTASAQLREAIDNGQLQIYLVDLLDAARRSLSGERSAPEEDAVETPDAASEEAKSEDVKPAGASEEHPKVDIGFEAFLGDLTSYLNSSDYIVEFMADSIRQWEHLVAEIQDEMASENVQRFRDEIERSKAEADAVADRLSHVEALQKIDWKGALEQVAEELEQARQQFTADELDALRDRLHGHIGDWFESGRSLQELVVHGLQPEIRTSDEKLHGRADQLARERFHQRNGGLKLDAQTVGHLHKLDLSLDALFRDFDNRPQGSPNGTNGIPPISLHQEDLPVKKGFLDWITFRSTQSIRRRLLGPEEPSDRPLNPNIKEKRLGEAAKGHLVAQVDRYVQEDLHQRDQQALQEVVGTYGAFCEEAIRSRLEESRAELKSRENALRARSEAGKRLIHALEALNSASMETLESADTLRQRFVSHHPEEAPTPLPQEEDADQTPPDTATVEAGYRADEPPPETGQ